MNTQTIALSKIVADENQPRKYFNAEKLNTLRESIKKFGIINPLVVQEIGKDKYLLVDGERRYRAATLLKLDKVPVLIEKPQSGTDRLVRQFNIQEQHEAWTPIEKAIAIDKLSKELGISLAQTCKLLNITEGDMRRYTAFAEIVDKENYVRNEIPLDYAMPLRSLKNRVRNIVTKDLEEDYNVSDEKKLEHRIITLVKTGVILKRGDLTKLIDAFNKKPELIKKFLADAKTTPTSIFSEAKARGAYHLRNTVYSARYLSSHGKTFLSIQDVKLTPENITQLKEAINVARQLISLAE